MNVFVTGATGFVGGHIVPQLIQEGYNVICLVRNCEKADILKSMYPVQTVIGDVTEPESLLGIERNVDYVIHLAAMGHVSAVTDEAYDAFVRINEGGTKNLIREFRKNGDLKKFIHFSSTAAMGFIGESILNEESVPNPITPYQKSKRRSEKIVEDAIEHGFPAIILRPCMIYGPGGYGEFYKFCRLMKRGLFPKVGIGKNLTPLLYIDDVVLATILAIKKGVIGQSYIVASERSLPMDELHHYIMKYVGKKAPYLFMPVFLALAGAKVIEKVFPLIGKEPIVTYNNIKSTITDRTFDISNIKRDLDYEQSVGFEEGIAATINWYRSQEKI